MDITEFIKMWFAVGAFVGLFLILVARPRYHPKPNIWGIIAIMAIFGLFGFLTIPLAAWICLVGSSE